MLHDIWTRLRSLDPGLKIALALFVLSAVLLGLTGSEEHAQEPGTATEARPAPAQGEEDPQATPEPQGEEAQREPAGPSLRMLSTGLGRLGVATMAFPPGSPMDIEVVDGHFFVLARHGPLTWYDPAAETFVEIAAVEMNRTALRKSPIRRLDNFKNYHFRTLGLLVEPQAEGYRAYVAHHLFADECFHFRISVLTLEIRDGRPVPRGGPRPLYTTQPCVPPMLEASSAFAGNQGGGRMMLFDDRHLLVTIGDHSLDGVNAPSVPLDPASPYGKVMLVDKLTGEARVYASGLRNPQGMMHTDSGEILITDHGPMGGDELNLIEDGGVYGWPAVTYGIAYGGNAWPFSNNQGRHEGYTGPLYAWLPSIGISALSEVPAGAFEVWQGDLLVASLREQTLHRLRRADGRIVYDERIEIGHRLRDIEPLDSGEIVLITDDRKIIVLIDGGALFAEIEMKASALAPLLPLVVREPGEQFRLYGEELFAERCASCHGLNGEVDVSVPLDGLFDRTVGGFPGYAYSAVLREDERAWTELLFRQFLLRPQATFPGTSMPAPNVSPPEVDALIDFLKD